ncbi:Dolichyl-phosphate-mannose--protein mannosyltransferase 4 [Coemansia sp. RSA 552]|nr:Dolichyl-phosphate-mannose--protein mannosyltransferase 4 [Coemansia sp. RSA 552]
MSADEPQLRRRPLKASGAPAATSTPADSDTDGEGRRVRTAGWFVRNSSQYAFATVVLLSLATRFWKIWDPAQVVFDEVHFGKFASYYLRRQYYFDVHPPLAKMLVAVGGWLVGYDGHFLFEKIGTDYVKNGVPYLAMRGWVALFGAALPPLAYMIMAESGYSVLASLLVAVLVTFDNALVTHGRLILLDNFMVFFMLAAVYSYIRFFKLRYRAFGAQWWTWLVVTGVMLGCTVSCKLVGLLTIGLVGLAVIHDLWRILDVRRGTSPERFMQHVGARALGLIAVPIMVYLGCFYIHFAALTHTGPGDAYHTPRFQMQLIDSPVLKLAQEVHYGDEISFRHRDTGVFLESVAGQNYPLHYEDKRVSSRGQQVTGAKELTDNAYWRVKPAQNQTAFTEFLARRQAGGEVAPEELVRWSIRHGDIVQLEHVNSQTNLRTHDVASPLTPSNMEFTTMALNSTTKVEDTLFQIQINRAKTNATLLQTHASFIRVVSKPHKVAMWTHSKHLPDWGRRHQEINGNKKPAEGSNVWEVAGIQGREPTAEEQAAAQRKVEPMGFLERFSELQARMLHHNSLLTSTHPFQSSPLTWPLTARGVSYWENKKERRQIYLMGNLFGWWMAAAAMAAYAMVIAILEAADRRQHEVASNVAVRHIWRSTGFLAMGWAMHYWPFFLMGRSLFLHHYLPALIFSYMVLGGLFHFLSFCDYQRFALRHWNGRARALLLDPPATVFFIAVVAAQIACFVYYSPMVYGTTSLTPDEVNRMRWLSSFDFQHQK